jgi:hypothetical protein
MRLLRKHQRPHLEFDKLQTELGTLGARQARHPPRRHVRPPAELLHSCNIHAICSSCKRWFWNLELHKVFTNNLQTIGPFVNRRLHFWTYTLAQLRRKFYLYQESQTPMAPLRDI